LYAADGIDPAAKDPVKKYRYLIAISEEKDAREYKKLELGV